MGRDGAIAIAHLPSFSKSGAGSGLRRGWDGDERSFLARTFVNIRRGRGEGEGGIQNVLPIEN